MDTKEGRTNPRPVSALEYVHTVLRANNEAGLMIDRTHMATVQTKLLDELKLPRIRVLQVLNRLSVASKNGENSVNLTVDDVRMILQLGNSLI